MVYATLQAYVLTRVFRFNTHSRYLQPWLA